MYKTKQASLWEGPNKWKASGESWSMWDSNRIWTQYHIARNTVITTMNKSELLVMH